MKKKLGISYIWEYMGFRFKRSREEELLLIDKCFCRSNYAEE